MSQNGSWWLPGGGLGSQRRFKAVRGGKKTHVGTYFPPLGAQVGTQFWSFLAPEWSRRGLKTHLDERLHPDTNFEAKMALPGPPRTLENVLLA